MEPPLRPAPAIQASEQATVRSLARNAQGRTHRPRRPLYCDLHNSLLTAVQPRTSLGRVLVDVTILRSLSRRKGGDFTRRQGVSRSRLHARAWTGVTARGIQTSVYPERMFPGGTCTLSSSLPKGV